MPNELTNLLPQERQRAFSRDYVLRLATVAELLFTALILIAAALLLPSYVFLTKSEQAKRGHLANIESTMSSAEEKNLSARLSVLAADTATLIALERAPAVSTIVREMLAIPRPGIALSGFSYVSATAKKPGTLAVSGVAKTRDALRGYQTALQSVSFARSADLPVSAYAKDSDIPFTITLMLVP